MTEELEFKLGEVMPWGFNGECCIDMIFHDNPADFLIGEYGTPFATDVMGAIFESLGSEMESFRFASARVVDNVTIRLTFYHPNFKGWKSIRDKAISLLSNHKMFKYGSFQRKTKNELTPLKIRLAPSVIDADVFVLLHFASNTTGDIDSIEGWCNEMMPHETDDWKDYKFCCVFVEGENVVIKLQYTEKNMYADLSELQDKIRGVFSKDN